MKNARKFFSILFIVFFACVLKARWEHVCNDLIGDVLVAAVNLFAIKMFETSVLKIFSGSLKVVQALSSGIIELFFGTALGLVTMHIFQLNNCRTAEGFIGEYDPIWKTFQSAIPLIEIAMILYCAVKLFTVVGQSIRRPQQGLTMASVSTVGAVMAILSFGK